MTAHPARRPPDAAITATVHSVRQPLTVAPLSLAAGVAHRLALVASPLAALWALVLWALS